MGGEIRTIQVTVTTLDIEHWHPGWRAAAEASPGEGYHDWAIRGLREAVQRAADAYLATHPDLFGVADATVN